MFVNETYKHSRFWWNLYLKFINAIYSLLNAIFFIPICFSLGYLLKIPTFLCTYSSLGVLKTTCTPYHLSFYLLFLEEVHCYWSLLCTFLNDFLNSKMFTKSHQNHQFTLIRVTMLMLFNVKTAVALSCLSFLNRPPPPTFLSNEIWVMDVTRAKEQIDACN